MKRIISIITLVLMFVFVVGCSSNEVKRDPVLDENLTAVADKIYATSELNKDFKDSLEFFNVIEIEDDNIKGYLGETDIKIKEGICSAPAMSSVAYEMVLLKIEDDSDVEKVKAEIKENANPRKWLCVEAEEVVVESIDNTVLFLMANKSEAAPIKEAFLNLAEAK